jgi:hypothetical protein
MQETIKPGTILIEEETPFPKSVTLESEPYSPGWKLVRGLDGYALNRKTQEAG